jgi:hypothetical protein
VSFCTRGGLGASHAPIYDTFNVQPRLISRPDPRPARDARRLGVHPRTLEEFLAAFRDKYS